MKPACHPKASSDEGVTMQFDLVCFGEARSMIDQPREQMAASVQVFGRRHDDAIHALGGRRPKSAKARNRGKWGTGGAAGAMEI
jgi:hypothetical protein